MGGAIRHDPAIDRWVEMRESYWKHFRFTPRTTAIALIGFVAVPTSIFYLINSNEHMWKWDAKRKGESLLKVAPPTPAPAAEED